MTQLVRTAQGRWDKELRTQSKNDLVRLCKQAAWDYSIATKLARVACIELYRRCPEHDLFTGEQALNKESLALIKTEARRAGMLINEDDGK